MGLKTTSYLFLQSLLLIYSISSSPVMAQNKTDEDAVREIWDAAKKGLVKSPTLIKNWLSTLKEARTLKIVSGSKSSVRQSIIAYAILVRLADQKVVWDAMSLVELGLKGAALANWVYDGAPIPYLAAISATIAAYKIPAMRTYLDEKVFGSYLPGPENEYPLEEFTDSKLVNKPYLLCNRYGSQKDMEEGNRPVSWDYAYPADNPDLGKDYQHFDRLRRQDYIVVPGRWIKVRQKGAFEYVVRFATTMNPLDLQLTCWNSMMGKSKVAKGKERTLLELKTFELTVPLVAYSNFGQSYPIYFYSPLHEKEGNAEKRVAIRLVDQDEPKQGMQVDKTDYLAELIGWANLTRIFAAPDRLEFVNKLPVFYETYRKLQRMYNTGTIPATKDLVAMGLSTLISAEKVIKTTNELTNWRQLHNYAFWYFLLNAAYTTASYASSVPRMLINTLGPVLEGPKKDYPMDEFTAVHKFQTADLGCRYFGEPKKGQEEKLLTWTWATKENGDYVPLQGRWIEDKSSGDASIFFGTLEDYVKLTYYCMVTSLPKVSDRLGGSTVSRVELGAGNSSLKNPYPIVFYFPVHNQDKKDTALIFHPEAPASKSTR